MSVDPQKGIVIFFPDELFKMLFDGFNVRLYFLNIKLKLCRFSIRHRLLVIYGSLTVLVYKQEVCQARYKRVELYCYNLFGQSPKHLPSFNMLLQTSDIESNIYPINRNNWFTCFPGFNKATIYTIKYWFYIFRSFV